MPQAENTWLRSDLYQYHRQSSLKCEYEIKKKRSFIQAEIFRI